MSKNQSIIRLTFTILITLTLGLSSSNLKAQTFQIAAAANLQKVFDGRIIPEFEKISGIKVTPTYGATGLLAKQLENGAPWEMFISADVKTVKKLEDEKLLDPKTENIYAVGQLVLWSKSLDLSNSDLKILLKDSVKFVAVANPKTAPYGAAAIEALKSENLDQAVTSKIVYAENISQAYQYAQTGNADVAFTALSLVIGAPKAQQFLVPRKDYQPIAQAFAATPTASKNASQFAQFLLSKQGQEIFESSGYLSPRKLPKQ